jgi:hypothetical protein
MSENWKFNSCRRPPHISLSKQDEIFEHGKLTEEAPESEESEEDDDDTYLHPIQWHKGEESDKSKSEVRIFTPGVTSSEFTH